MFKTVTVQVPLSGGDFDQIDIQVFACDKCGRDINGSKEPIIIDQSCVTVVHPSGYDEVVHEPNCKAGYLNQYCLDCATAEDTIPFFSKKERLNVLNALVRRYDLEGYDRRNPSLKAKMVAKNKEFVEKAPIGPVIDIEANEVEP